MNEEFEYEIKTVDSTTGCLTVLLKKSGCPEYLCSVPKPENDQDLYEVLRAFVPLALWQQTNVGVVPAVVPQTEESVISESEPMPLPEPPIVLVSVTR